ncbi:hypothetical protein EJB05_51400, partial [Eragrostis curvula]
MRAAIYRDWPGLPEDLILIVMRELAIPDLLRAGAVCTTWRAACAEARRVQFPITDSSPCLLYKCAADDADTATVYSVSTGAVFKVRLLPPTLRTRHVVGSGHGWIVTADAAYRPGEIHHPTPTAAPLMQPRRRRRVRRHARAPGIRDLYFAHVATTGGPAYPSLRTSLAMTERCNFHGAVHNKKDGNFYVISDTGYVYALDLNGPSPPAVRAISAGRGPAVVRMPGALWSWCDIVLAPWGDILQVWRHKRWCLPTAPVDDPDAYPDDILLAKVDVDDRKQVKMSAGDLRGHSLFLGLNASMCLPTKDFPGLKPNCAYLTSGSWKQFSLTNCASGTLKPTRLSALASRDSLNGFKNRLAVWDKMELKFKKHKQSIRSYVLSNADIDT